MAVDPFLPVAPARLKALVVPVGHITHERLTTFVSRLNAESIVSLRDVTPDARPHRNMFSPLAFPDGVMFYDLMMHHPPASHLSLSPFELFREPLAIIAIADGVELHKTVFSKRNSGGRTVQEANIRTLYQDLEGLRDKYPRALAHQVLIFDYVAANENPVPIPEGIVTIPPAEQLKRTTIKTVMCDIAALVLAEMTTLAKSYEGMSFIDSPGQPSTRPPGVEDDVRTLPRRNSQFSLPMNRSTSTSGLPDRGPVRMSMPPVPSKGQPLESAGSSPARPSTPVNSSKPLPSPPSTFDNIIGPMQPNSPPQQAGFSSGETGEVFRGQDRVPVHGFGAGGLNDRWRHKGKARIQIVIGSLYLQAGLWNNALKELTEGATVAKSLNDHVWHGKALELTLVCLLLLGWAGIEFRVPSILLPPHDKGTSAAMALQEAELAVPHQPPWLLHLQMHMPELLDRIMGLYSRISAERLPPLPHSEAIIRFCKMSAAIHTANGRLCRESLEMMVLGVPPRVPLTTSPRFTIQPTRTQIIGTLFRAFPASSSSELLLTTVDRVVILSGIASVLGHLGFHRKKAMVLRELVVVLVGGLVEARTRGAADVGIHPAAGLIGLNGASARDGAGSLLELAEGDVEYGIDSFLGVLMKTYGVVGGNTLGDEGDRSDETVIARIREQSAARFFGMQSVKLDILRTCINFSEALPDLAGVLKYSSDLLRTAGSGIAPGPRRENAYPSISKEEQVRLVTNILKTSNLSRRLGIGPLEAEYWDEFLVRGVSLEALPPTRTPFPHPKTVLPGITAMARSSQDVDPFIYNPFLKRPDSATVDHTLVAGEPASFRLTLQNPYEIEIELESIRLDTEGAEFEPAVETTTIGPYRTHIMRISGTPKAAGTVRVTGAVIKVRGCRERRFPIFAEPWAPEDEVKIKAIGLGALAVNAATVSPAIRRLKPTQIELNVIAPQPVVVVKSSTLPQSSAMILEGERQSFSVTLQNLSTTTPADFLLFSFKDSTQEPLQQALNNRDATATELYEYELVLAKKQPLRLRNRDDSKRFIAPGQTATFDFELLGRPGLTHGLIQVDYAYLGVPHDEVADKFYTRRVSMELTITVNASIEITRADILPLTNSIPTPLWSRLSTTDNTTNTASAITSVDNNENKKMIPPSDLSPDTHCLLLLDLRNSWPSQMTVSLTSSFREERKGEEEEEEEEEAKEYRIQVEENILPGHTARVILPIQRVYVEDPHAFIPALNPARQRQFVVSTKIAPEVERASREAFWYRERVLDSLKARWRTPSGGAGGGMVGRWREGEIELRAVRFSPRMVEAVRVDEIDVDVAVEGLLPAAGEDGKAESGRFVVNVDEFLQLRVRVTNRSAKPVYPLLRLTPVLCHRPFNVSLDFTRKMAKFAWNGTLQQALPLLGANGGMAEVRMGVTALCRGEFEILASVEETRLWVDHHPAAKEEEAARRKDGEEGQQQQQQPEQGGEGGVVSTTEAEAQAIILGAALGKKERRIWHARRGCKLVVRDSPQR